MKRKLNLFTVRVLVWQLLLCNSIFAQVCSNDSTGYIPISDLGSTLFNGKAGGLYGNGFNSMPVQHKQNGIQLSYEIRPLDWVGNFDPNGKIGFLSMGMSNANLFFKGFRDSSVAYADLNNKLVMVNGATGGYDIDLMLDTTSQYWTILNQKMNMAGISIFQVQVIWFMQAKHISGIPANEGIEHITIMENKFLNAFTLFKRKFPNLKQIFCSGRDYGGYSQLGSGNPEPYAYYTNWSFRNLVERQINADSNLSYQGIDSKIVWLGWANHVWADGKNQRLDGFNWLCPEHVQTDGVHPNSAGVSKVASLLFNFFKNDSTTLWFRNQVNLDLIQKSEIEPAVLLYPNPANSTLNIKLSNTNFIKFEILNNHGHLVKVFNINQTDVSDLPKGIYTLRVYFPRQIIHKRFIVY